jgi:hypothetical protein
MFGPMKEALRGRFSSNEVSMVQNWLKAQLKTHFSGGIKKLLKCWNQCIEVKGDYIEKYY